MSPLFIAVGASLIYSSIHPSDNLKIVPIDVLKIYHNVLFHVLGSKHSIKSATKVQLFFDKCK